MKFFSLKENQKGITLIALVVTIIILLILAGVAIGFAMNGNGLFDKTKTSVQEYVNEQDKEQQFLNESGDKIDEQINGGKVYKITYDANGGTGSMETSNGINSVTVAENEFISPETGKVFLSWNTKADKSGTTYKPGETLSSNEILYAIWGRESYSAEDVVTLGTGENAENFYVVANSNADSTTVTLLTEKCVNTNGYIQTDSYNRLSFGSYSGCTYESSWIKPHVDAYKTALESRTGISIQEARLLYRPEALALNSNIRLGSPNRVSYWLGTPVSYNAFYMVAGQDPKPTDVESNGLRGLSADYDRYAGLRPVVTVLKSYLE